MKAIYSVNKRLQIWLAFEKFSRADQLSQIALEIMWLPILITCMSVEYVNILLLPSVSIEETEDANHGEKN